MRQVWIRKAGGPQVLELREARDPLPAPGELRIRTEASAVGYPDVLARRGRAPGIQRPPLVPGLAVSGRVDTVGEDVGTDWIGRDVFALTALGGYRDVVCVPEHLVFARPTDMNPTAAATLPIAYLTALLAVDVLGGLQEGDSVLVDGVSGGVGTASLQIARHVGAQVIGLADEAKHAPLKSLGLENCIDPASEDVSARVRGLTEGRGLQLVVQPAGLSDPRHCIGLLAPTGRVCVFGFWPRWIRGRRSWLRRRGPKLRLGQAQRALAEGGHGLLFANPAALWDSGDALAHLVEQLLGGWRAGAIQPLVDTSYPLEAAADAHRDLETRRKIGMIALQCGQPAPLPAE